jgi:predicted DNA-binding protein
MSKGKIIAFRISEEMYRNLVRIADTEGCAVSDVMRNIMTEHIRVEDLYQALQETRKDLSGELLQIRQEIAKIRTPPQPVKQEYQSFAEYKKSLGR